MEHLRREKPPVPALTKGEELDLPFCASCLRKVYTIFPHPLFKDVRTVY